jgi:hypothetical protein
MKFKKGVIQKKKMNIFFFNIPIPIIFSLKCKICKITIFNEWIIYWIIKNSSLLNKIKYEYA